MCKVCFFILFMLPLEALNSSRLVNQTTSDKFHPGSNSRFFFIKQSLKPCRKEILENWA